ncbi:MAG: class I SAM-dependent methyltransferase [Actinobacteria bacterium]|nr:class I SAM-dependent methyltransferase [Actinomycetota bacterium]
MEFEGRRLLRATFDDVADEYGLVRPAYPVELFGDLVDLAGLPARGRLIEIGCGTGEATRPLAERGFEITCIELGFNVAQVARRQLEPFANVKVVNAAFEEWEPECGGFDAVVAFAAFHWIDPEVRLSKPARLLCDGGALAVTDWQDTLPEDGDGFFIEVEEDYAAVVPEWGTEPPRRPDCIADRVKDHIEASGLFQPVRARRYLWEVVYTADDYVSFLNTRSSYRLLDGSNRLELFRRIRQRIQARPAQSVRKAFLADLNVAVRH